LRDPRKSLKIAAMCDHLLVSTAHLGQALAASGTPATVLPTPVDTDRFRPRSASAAPTAGGDTPPRIGWIGNGGNLAYLPAVVPALADVARSHGAVLHVVSDQRFGAAGLVVDNEPWSLSGEPAALARMTIGIMPLPDTPYARGKAGYKILVYWAAGLPVIASPVGANADLIDDGVDGFLATSIDAWRTHLRTLLDDPGLRVRMGAAGRRKVEAHYTYDVVTPQLVDVLRGLRAGRNDD